jgi:cytochrome c biogenesis protein CcmG/thiol:disulfide interchange protein DsbE
VRRLLLIVPVVLLAALVAIMGWLLVGADDGARDASTIPSALIGRPAPDFALPPVNAAIPGGFSTADLKGRPAIVNVFASWCVPCLAEHPLISALAAEGYRVFGLNHKDAPEAAARWLAAHGNPYTAVGADTDGRASIEWGVTGVPETFIVDAEGIVRFKYAGPLTPELIERKLRPVLDEVGR